MNDRASNSIAFERWMHEVDRETYRLVGLSIHDLPDQSFRDAWRGGVGPRSFAEEALLGEGFPLEGEQ